LDAFWGVLYARWRQKSKEKTKWGSEWKSPREGIKKKWKKGKHWGVGNTGDKLGCGKKPGPGETDQKRDEKSLLQT